MSKTATQPLYFVVTFWGRKYRNWFCRYPLASLLSPKNIPILERGDNHRFLICTTQKDWNELQKEVLFRNLRKIIEPRFIILPELSENLHKYSRMSLGHKLLLNVCFEAGAIAIYMCPDTIIPNGCVEEAIRLIQGGKKVVLCTAIRFEMDGVERDITNAGIRKPGQALSITRRQAVDIGLHNLHSESRAGEWDAPNFGELNPDHYQNYFPTCCYWKVQKEEGIVISTHNWAPFAIDFSALAEHDTRTFDQWAIDGDYVYRNFKTGESRQDIHVVDDSDSLIILGLTPRNEMITKKVNYFWQRWPIVGQWSKGFILNKAIYNPQMDELKRQIYDIPVRWHSGDLSAAWSKIESRASAIVSQYSKYNLTPGPTLAALTSWGEVGQFFFSRRFLQFLWIVCIFYLVLPCQQTMARVYSAFLRRIPKLGEMPKFRYGSVDRKRIRRRWKAIFSRN